MHDENLDIKTTAVVMAHGAMTPKEIRTKIRRGEICCAGNYKLKIFGLLSCKSGKRMKNKNRIFFASQSEAVAAGYRPCGHCMRSEYAKR